MIIYLIIFSVPLIGIIYSIGENFKIWDKISGRDKAIKGINRLRSGAGYPVCFIYNDKQDLEIFDALYRRIFKIITINIKIKIKSGEKVSLIAVMGQPTSITGLPQDWLQEDKFFYSENHPVLIAFGTTRDSSGGSDDRTNG
jgi:hypothetical protein